MSAAGLLRAAPVAVHHRVPSLLKPVILVFVCPEPQAINARFYFALGLSIYVPLAITMTAESLTRMQMSF